ncbi:bifunctional tetrahydrofolate synthase/dihydrofolate synthase [Alteromonas sp. ASW11-36]|uniref:Dihydrofolate synthase/folylpolyglutamate synthase n=1 Tax=Alteromonas arenosi TaxID=3055817 RepID=A0ABT7SVW3_9ALTE|nr:bifunctional tetrahydrofolate synthase/dihydrofolate synthase [Alteromonas sp. ASW11-36]MDM7860332.1 bifunctional tetrahydrofolate synthase/dihydrofolate synthase [Alteromonas sp. ASW11-36]
MNNTAEYPKTTQSSWSLEQWLAYLMAIHPTEIDMSLGRVNRVFNRLALDFSSTRVVTVGGTNGKGSTCRFLELALLQLDKSVGVYSSPHLISFTERVRLNDTSPGESQFCQALLHIERMRGNDSLTYFEFSTLAALWLIAQAKPDYLILEVGLGGRLDATNIVDNHLAVITSIALDHQEYLGDTRESVAYEKAGIFRVNSPIVLGERDVPDVMLNQAQRSSGEVLWKGREFDFDDNHQPVWDWRGPNYELRQLPKPLLPIDNVATALAALAVLGELDELNAKPALLWELVRTAALPGRFQRLSFKPDWIVDVGHNPHAAALVVKQLQALNWDRLFIIVGMMRDKAMHETLATFAPLAPLWIPVGLPTERAASIADLHKALAPQEILTSAKSVAEGVKSILPQLSERDVVLVFGSFVTVAEMLTFNTQQRL